MNPLTGSQEAKEEFDTILNEPFAEAGTSSAGTFTEEQEAESWATAMGAGDIEG